jgi:hypothetical protein
MKNILLEKPQIEIFMLNTEDQIAKAQIIEVTDFEIKIAIINRIQELKMGDSIQCKFEYKNQSVRFNAKVKDETSFFLIGELIFDNEKNYLRVDDGIKLNYKKINISNINNYMSEVFSANDNIISIPTLIDTQDQYFRIFQHLISKIDELNENITNLTDIIQNNGSKFFEEMFVNISASGMKIKKQEDVKIGDVLFIEIKLEINLHYYIIKIIGEVIQVKNDYFIIEYRMISNKSKENIIRYSLQKERENIRLNK